MNNIYDPNKFMTDSYTESTKPIFSFTPEPVKPFSFINTQQNSFLTSPSTFNPQPQTTPFSFNPLPQTTPFSFNPLPQTTQFSFNPLPQTTEETQIKEKYKVISQKFIEQYYNLYDTNMNNYASLFYQDANISYLNIEFNGISKLMEYLRSINIVSFKHENINFTSQLCGKLKILLLITGSMTTIIRNNVTAQNQVNKFNFSETIILTKSTQKNSFFITNVIFKQN